MAAEQGQSSAYFHWNAGWFGVQFGCTAFLLPGFIQYLGKDSLMASFCLASFAVLNAWGFCLWSLRKTLDAYSAIQRFTATVAVVLAVLVIAVNQRGLAEPVPLGVLAIFPAIMLMFFCQKQLAQHDQKSRPLD